MPATLAEERSEEATGGKGREERTGSEARLERDAGKTRRRSRRCRVESGGAMAESPTSAVTTTRLAAAAADCDCCSNKAGSCHKHLLFNTTHMYSHLWTHTDAARVALCAFPLYGSLLSFFSFFCPCSLIRPAVIALCSL